MKLPMFKATLAATALFVLGAGAASAAEHPAYLHALTDLKRAEVVVKSRGGSHAMSVREQAAINDINGAQYAIYHIAPEEQKNVDAAIAADADPSLRAGKLHDARAFLEKAKSDCAEFESDKAFLGERQRLLILINAAIQQVDLAIKDYNEHE
jgi:hypothetical protein